MGLPRLEPLIPHREATASFFSDQLVSVEGEQVYFQRSGSGSPLLLLHGLAASSYSFRQLIPLLESRFEIIAIDLCGFGYTERSKDRARYEIARQAETIVSLMSQLGFSEFGICGHSLGSAVAVTAANRYPERVTRLALVSPVPRFETPPKHFRNALSLHLFYLVCRILLSRPQRFKKVMGRAFFQKDSFSEEASEEYRRRLLIEGLRDSFFGYAVALGRNQSLELEYKKLIQETLVLGGEEDEIIPPEELRELAKRIPKSQLELLSDCGHSAPEEFPERVAEILRANF